MLHLTIITANNWAVLGLTAVCKFFEAMKNSPQYDGKEGLDSTLIVDDAFLQCVETMPPDEFPDGKGGFYESGFSPKFKEQFLDLLRAQKGKYIFLYNGFVLEGYNVNTRSLFHFVESLNNGLNFEDAKAEMKRFRQELEAAESATDKPQIDA